MVSAAPPKGNVPTPFVDAVAVAAVAAVLPTWSFKMTDAVVPATPEAPVANGKSAVPSSIASMMATVTLVLLSVSVVISSLPAMVAPSTPTLVTATLLSAGLPGMVTVIAQVMAVLAARLAVGSVGLQAPTTTVAPGSVLDAVAVQVGLVAAVAPMLVQTTLPVKMAPGPAVAGKPVIATFMSAGAPTMMVATAVSQMVLGDGSVQILYGTV
jgi:hypothetical protein